MKIIRIFVTILVLGILTACSSEPIQEPEPTWPTVRSGRIGDVVGDDRFNYVVSSCKCRAERCLANITVENIDNQQWMIFADFQTVFDAQGQEFSANGRRSSPGLSKYLQPGEKVAGTLVWDVPVDFVPHHLELQSWYLATPVRVDLA